MYKLCECGCGNQVTKPKNRFLAGHNLDTRKLKSKVCTRCKSTYHPTARTQKFCSRKCYNLIGQPSRRKRAVSTCQICAAKFEHKSYRKAKYCSRSCWSKRRKPNIISCAGCPKKFDTKDKRQKYCTAQCRHKHAVGKNAPAYKHGKCTTKLRHKLSNKLSIWRKIVYKRDNWTCQHCGKKGDINAHHVKPLAQYPKLALEPSNGITLCVDCHSKVHGRAIPRKTPFQKKCKDCGAKTSGRSTRCRSCGQKYHHAKKGYKPFTPCKLCGKDFRTKSGQNFCSRSCGAKHNHSSKTLTG